MLARRITPDFVEMLYILLSWMIQFLITCSIGFAIRSLLGRRFSVFRNRGQIDLFELFWLGLAGTLASAQVVSIWIPLGSDAFILWLVSGAFGFSLLLPKLLERVREYKRVRPEKRTLILAFVCISGCGLAAHHLGASNLIGHDTNLYHFSWIRWTNEYPAVPGIANLHSRLAMNSGFLLFAALTDNAWWDRESAWLIAGLFVVFAFCRLSWIIFGRRPALGRAGRPAWWHR